ncbi:MAG: PIG-L family deacetylase [Planctomycetes bacterium]|nr:PIG-L family deacetylase [Planctomycetota bacterium]
MNDKNVVYIGAHPDDIGCVCGTMLLLKQKGYKIHDMCLTLGQHGGDDPDIVNIRNKEESAVCEILDAEMTFFDQMDGELFAGREVCEAVAERLKVLQPALIITTWPFEKPDHAAAYGVAHKAMCMAELRWECEFYMASADGPSYRFDPDIYVNVTPVIEDAERILRCYPSQWNDETVKRFLQIKQHYGFQATWCEYAEGLRLALPQMNKRWDRPTEVGRILLDL